MTEYCLLLLNMIAASSQGIDYIVATDSSVRLLVGVLRNEVSGG